MDFLLTYVCFLCSAFLFPTIIAFSGHFLLLCRFLVELEMVMPRETLLFESHDLGMELQYEIEAREEVERCFVHIDYETRPYDEHVVSKVPELREKYRIGKSRSRSSSSL